MSDNREVAALVDLTASGTVDPEERSQMDCLFDGKNPSFDSITTPGNGFRVNNSLTLHTVDQQVKSIEQAPCPG